MQGWVRVSRNHFTWSLKKEAHTLTTPLSLYSDADELNRSSNNLNMTSRCSKHWKVAVAAPSQSQSIPIAGISRSQSELEDLAHAELLADYRDGQMYERISKFITCCSWVLLYYAPIILELNASPSQSLLLQWQVYYGALVGRALITPKLSRHWTISSTPRCKTTKVSLKTEKVGIPMRIGLLEMNLSPSIPIRYENRRGTKNAILHSLLQKARL